MEKKKDNSISVERINWLKEVAWHLARVTRKYDRSIYDELPVNEKSLLYEFEHKESLLYIEEIKSRNDVLARKTKGKASSSISYLFPMGEA